MNSEKKIAIIKTLVFNSSQENETGTGARIIPLYPSHKTGYSEGKMFLLKGKNIYSYGKNILAKGKNIYSYGKMFLLKGKKIYSYGKNILSKGKKIYSYGKMFFPPGKAYKTRKKEVSTHPRKKKGGWLPNIRAGPV